MPQYLVAIHHPDNFDPSTVTAETMRDIGALNKEMMAAGVRFFAGGLQPETKAKSLRAQPNGQVLITDGAGKSLITIRPWWSSGFEMTFVGAIEGLVTYMIGIMLGRISGAGI
jgi:hypothetical protein